ncbi:PREDICTED: G-type lectin S-receptor-like serine/threonine-protein kinase At4g27290 [Ipomoea nil]|uniref:G-type lectin S-receptor-like serine/threonine-protein kinase At4g27290 n=1 Tax=Ipomoea nil TaxID=35883 RepID=UPI000900BBFD|nr:PREDICTED: G-type lectin S-receptor-like serine/threonine-protein kinase At4g27290 [Ipomoea nil]
MSFSLLFFFFFWSKLENNSVFILQLNAENTRKLEMKSLEGLRLYFFCSTLLSLFTLCTSADTITPDHLITDGTTIVSAGGNFELGFFSPGKSKNRYVGIWYSKIPTKDVVWVANRDTPLNNTSGKLLLRDNGILVLLDGSKEELWSSNSSISLKNPVAQLSDTGNLVVREGNDHTSKNSAWQSFDYPGNTLLPGMKLGRNLATGHVWYQTSWKSADDPAVGEYTEMININGFPEIFEIRGANKSPLYRSGPWNGEMFTGVPKIKDNPYYTFEFIMNDTEIYYTYELIDSSVPSRVVMNPTGIIERLTWIERTKSWIVYLTAQTDNCDRYGMCGAFGKCNINSSPPCDCLKGFIPKYPQDWEATDWSNGCVRRTPLDCGDADRFLIYRGVKLPDTRHSWYDRSIGLEECKGLCLKNCSCTAYSNVDIRDGGSGCLLWFENLTDIKELDKVEQDLYVRIAASDFDISQNGQKKQEVMKIVIPTISGILTLSFLVWFALYKRKRGAEIGKEDYDLPLFTLETVVSATNNFSSDNLIGEGGFGPVYKGKLPTGTEIAVKKLSENSGQGVKEWENEVSIIAKLQHRNLVTLQGCCADEGQRILIYEYMPNNSLDYFIFDESRKRILTWQKRFEIAVGISRGLLYLHQDSRFKIIHRDLKASNILLDAELNAKISDFGLARIVGEDDALARTKRIIGTYGYMSPEYAIDGNFSVKSDVFSLGVIFLELISGRKNRTFHHSDHHHNLLGHTWLLWNDGDPIELMDNCVKDSYVESQVLRCIHVALLCVSKLPEDRPTMASVVFMLENEEVALPQPKEPGFFVERNSTEASSKNVEIYHSEVAKMTFSILEPR